MCVSQSQQVHTTNTIHYTIFTFWIPIQENQGCSSLLQTPSTVASRITRGTIYGHHFIPNLQPLGDLVQDEFAALRPQGRLTFGGVERCIGVLPMETSRSRSLFSLAYRRIVVYSLHLAPIHSTREGKSQHRLRTQKYCGEPNAKMQMVPAMAGNCEGFER